MRTPKFAGIFYEASETLLKNQIENCFIGERGPGELPGKRKGKIIAAIAPHAGYMYSGACAAWTYKAIAEAEIPDVYILIGPSHSSVGSGLSMESFTTPFGIVRTDIDLAKQIVEKGTLAVNEKLHANEHSIEVQLPFLQFVMGNDIEKLKVVQILISDDVDLTQVAVDIKEVLMDTGKKAVFIVSSDFTHFGPNYHYIPFVDKVQENIYALDKKAIDFILKGNHKGFLRMVEEERMTVCGSLPIALLLHLIKFTKADLEAYYTSGDLGNNYRNSVSYASILFR
jgi:AmmeMemoRadiSam system protein B